jgi:hypothetical protein
MAGPSQTGDKRCSLQVIIVTGAARTTLFHGLRPAHVGRVTVPHPATPRPFAAEKPNGTRVDHR